MTISERNIGAPVRMEQHDPELVAKVAKARDALELDTEIRTVTRMEGLMINELAAHKEMQAAWAALKKASAIYGDALEAYTDAVIARRKEEQNDRD